MNQQNYQFLTDTLERHGLGNRDVNIALKTKMELGQDEFDLKGLRLKFGADKMEYTPMFGKGEARDGGEAFYYLNRIKATLTKENGEEIKSEFSLYKQRGFNTREMFNLLNGRPVYRKPRGEEGRWSKPDFKSTDDDGNVRLRNYYDTTTNFSLTREIGKLPVIWANQQEKEDTLLDLQSGERVTAWIKQDGKREQVVIGVSPQLGGLTIYNSQMEVIKHTNTNAIEMVPDMNVGQDKTNNLTGDQKQKEQLPDSTKQIMNKINNSENTNKQSQGTRQRRAS